YSFSSDVYTPPLHDALPILFDFCESILSSDFAKASRADTNLITLGNFNRADGISTILYQRERGDQCIDVFGKLWSQFPFLFAKEGEHDLIPLDRAIPDNPTQHTPQFKRTFDTKSTFAIQNVNSVTGAQIAQFHPTI